VRERSACACGRTSSHTAAHGWILPGELAHHKVLGAPTPTSDTASVRSWHSVASLCARNVAGYSRFRRTMRRERRGAFDHALHRGQLATAAQEMAMAMDRQT